ncbi:MAG: MFS transporter [Thermomicrobiales bacterium]|nr:MFS transporter [Thermomicrobiales bacterium]
MSATTERSDTGVGMSGEQIKRGFTLLAIATFAAQMVIYIPQAISPNFFRDVIGMDGALNGYLVAIREVPGFLLIFVAALLLRQGLARAASISLIVAGIGYILFAGANTFLALIIPTLISSVGYHSWLQLQDALGLSLARSGEEGSVLGRFRSIGFAGTLVALIATFLILLTVGWVTGDLRAHQAPWLRGLYVATGLLAFFGAIVVVRFPIADDARAMARSAPRITWRKEYGLYYWLTFLDGSRQQIYFAFAPFVLVEEFQVDAQTLTLLMIVAALINWLTGSHIGRWVDRYGEKRMLTVGYLMHLAVFLGFALSRNIWLLYLTYLGYNFLFLFSIGTTTYLRKICRREDLAPSLAMGVSLSHLTAIVVPVIGATLWNRLGYQFPFLFGTVFIFISLWLTQKIDVDKQRITGAPLPATLRHASEEEIEADAPTLPGPGDGVIVQPVAAEGLVEADEPETSAKPAATGGGGE